MKICFWGNIYSALEGNPMGGGELQIALLAKAMVDKGFIVSIIDFEIVSDKILDSGIQLFSMKERKKRIFVCSNLIFFKLLVSINADYYYARIRSGIHSIAYLASKKVNSIFILGLANDLDTLSFKIRYSVYYRHLSFIKLVWKVLHCELLYNFLFYKASFVIVQHKIQKENLERKSINSSICENIYSDRIDESEIEISNNKRFIFLGALDKRKGIDDIFHIVNKLKNMKFIIIGRARDNYSKQVLQKLKDCNNVHYYGQLSNIEVKSIMHSCTALISTSKMEGFPNTFLEAWASGIPVLSLNVDPGGIIEQFHLGVHYNGNISNLIEDLRTFNANNYDRISIINYVKQNHSVENISTKFLKIIQCNNENI